MKDAIEYLKEYIISLLKANLDKKNIIEEKAENVKQKKKLKKINNCLLKINSNVADV
ncbi:MAG: hypothetical protein IID16_00835 [Candidatus Marinimicrobia bacterium]|nr:hypothetical protein [Candidatus Neomarinimicrobiota bacterium]